jgi:hypothetical protein
MLSSCTKKGIDEFESSHNTYNLSNKTNQIPDLMRVIGVIILFIIGHNAFGQLSLGFEAGWNRTLNYYTLEPKDETVMWKTNGQLFTYALHLNLAIHRSDFELNWTWKAYGDIGAKTYDQLSILSGIANYSFDFRYSYSILNGKRIKLLPFVGISIVPRVNYNSAGSGITGTLTITDTTVNADTLWWNVLEYKGISGNIRKINPTLFFQVGVKLMYVFNKGAALYLYGLLNNGFNRINEIQYDYECFICDEPKTESMVVATRGSFYMFNIGFSFPIWRFNKKKLTKE